MIQKKGEFFNSPFFLLSLKSIVEQIAGIPAFIAAGARGGLHIASREERLTVIPGITTAEEIERLIQSQNTVVIMKLSQCTDEVHRCIRLHPNTITAISRM